MTSGKEVFNERCRNSQGEMKRDHDFLEGKMYAKLREGIGNIFKSICGTEAQRCINKKKIHFRSVTAGVPYLHQLYIAN